MEHNISQPDPQQLRAEAEKEPSRRGLDDYSEVIRVLKEQKEFSFREIAAWFQQRGLVVDHNAIWRAYSKTVSGAVIGGSSERNEQNERRPAQGGAMPWME
jgi:hypothetical protein